MYKPRQLTKTILQVAKQFPAVLLTGPRQVGKTTLFHHLSTKHKHQYVSLDEFEYRSTAKNDPGLFLEQYRSPLIIDEIQYAPELLPYLKTRIDRGGSKISYWLTGSQYFHLMRSASESLAGRVAILKLLGLSVAEEKGLNTSLLPWTPARRTLINYSAINLKALFQRIVRGSFPKLLQNQSITTAVFYGSYVQTYIDRDLRDLVRVQSLTSFEKFIRLCAARTAQVLNLSDLARDSDISVNTAKDWLSLLESSGHVYLLQPYYKNISKRLIKSPKLYFLDTGLAAYLTGWKTGETAMHGAMAGALFETFIFSELVKNFWHRGHETPLWYYRTKEKTEVDILLEENGKLYPIEIKLSARVRPENLAGIYSLQKTDILLGPATIISAAPKPYPVAKMIQVIPYTVVEHF